MSEERTKIVERVRRLMAMAADSSSPNEAAIAARRARKLMDEHQVSVKDLGQSEFGSSSAGASRRFTPLWEQGLAIAIAKLNDCIARFQGNGGGYKVLQFDGFDEDVQVAAFMFHYLTEAAKRQCSAYMRAQGYTRYNARVGDTFKHNFSVAVREKITAMIKDREQVQMSDGRGLMVIKRDLVEREFGVARYTTGKRRRAADPEVARAGYEAGQRTNITTGVHGTPRKSVH